VNLTATDWLRLMNVAIWRRPVTLSIFQCFLAVERPLLTEFHVASNGADEKRGSVCALFPLAT
jgi:hypothetical protein